MNDVVTFEGEDIDAFSIQMRQYTGPIEGPLAVGEFVELKVIVRVTNVTHSENARTGVLERRHTVKVMDIDIV